MINFTLPLQHNYHGVYVLAMDETPAVIRVEYDRTSRRILGGAFSNETPFQTRQEVLDFCQSLGDINKFPKSSLWGSLSCLGIRTIPCPVFCIPTPLTRGVRNDFLAGFLKETLETADNAKCEVFVISTDGDPRWRAYAKNYLRKDSPNFPLPDVHYIEIDHEDAIYIALAGGRGWKVIMMDYEHMFKTARNQILNKYLIIGNYTINMFYLEEIRVDEQLKPLLKLSISDTNVQVWRGLVYF